VSGRLTLGAVERAADAIRPYLPPTPLRRSHALRASGEAYLKLECWQPTGSFKVRGATNTLVSLTTEERRRGVVAASAGNHALGVAFAVQALGGATSATLFVPETAPRAKIEKLRGFPVTVHVAGATYDDAHALAMAHGQNTGATYVHAFDDPRTAAGQGTAALEILDALPNVGTILVPVGGGGLIAGVAAAVKARDPSVRIVAVQPEASPALPESIRQGRALLEYPAGPTLADGLAGGIGEIVFGHRDLIDDVVLVSEAEIEDAIVALLGDDQVVAEASGAVGVAAIRSGKCRPGSRPVVAIVTGGNIDASVLGRLLTARA
jgi:threonine dehydratase